MKNFKREICIKMIADSKEPCLIPERAKALVDAIYKAEDGDCLYNALNYVDTMSLFAISQAVHSIIQSRFIEIYENSNR